MEEKQDLLVARLKAGNRSAAAEVVDMYYKQIYLFMRRLGHSHQVSEALTQDSFLRIWKHVGQVRSGKSLKCWLYRIASNVSKLYLRQHRGKDATSIEGLELAGSNEPEYDKIRRAEELEQLQEAIARLPLKLKQTIILHYMQHLTISEGAEVAGVAEGTFKSRLNRGLKALRKQVA